MSILFDFDGVLLNSRENMRRSWLEVQAECDVDVDFENYFALIGKPFQVILSELGISKNREMIEHTYFAASSRHIDALSLFPGIAETISVLAELRTPIGILTSKDPVRTRQFVRRFQLPISMLYSPTDTLRGKPEPDLFVAAADEWGVEPADITYIGDMSVDEEAATGFGAAYIHCEWGYGAPLTQDCKKAATPADLLDLLVGRYAPNLMPFLNTASMPTVAHRH